MKRYRRVIVGTITGLGIGLLASSLGGRNKKTIFVKKNLDEHLKLLIKEISEAIDGAEEIISAEQSKHKIKKTIDKANQVKQKMKIISKATKHQSLDNKEIALVLRDAERCLFVIKKLILKKSL